jgi:hypothetical protein
MFAGILALLLLFIGYPLPPVLIVAVSSSDGFTGAAGAHGQADRRRRMAMSASMKAAGRVKSPSFVAA